jgi:hypothetical protein
MLDPGKSSMLKLKLGSKLLAMALATSEQGWKIYIPGP